MSCAAATHARTATAARPPGGPRQGLKALQQQTTNHLARGNLPLGPGSQRGRNPPLGVGQLWLIKWVSFGWTSPAVDPQAVLLQLKEPGEGRHLGDAYLEDGRWAFVSLEGGRYEVQVIDWDDDSVLLRTTVNVTLGAKKHLDLLLDD